MDVTPVTGAGTPGGSASPLATPANDTSLRTTKGGPCDCGTCASEQIGNAASRYFVLFLVGLVRLYQMTAPFRPAVCRFHPTCSHYTIDALQKYGVIRGLWMALKRLSKCHPFHEGGYDPVL